MAHTDLSAWEVPDAISVTQLPNQAPTICLKNRLVNSSAKISLTGATIFSWLRNSQKDEFFVSSKADLSGATPIRGGIPISFPQFSGGVLPSHGIVRAQRWSIKETGLTNTGAPFVTLQFCSNVETFKLWPHQFEIEHTVTLDSTLASGFLVKNIGKQSFNFQLALHSYFAVSDISNVSVYGLAGLNYLDKVQGFKKFTEDSDSIRFNSETDRIYLSSRDSVELRDSQLKAALKFEKDNLPEVVVWNPWIEKSKSIKDLDPSEYKKFVCVEVGAIEPAIRLEPNQVWTAMQRLT